MEEKKMSVDLEQTYYGRLMYEGKNIEVTVAVGDGYLNYKGIIISLDPLELKYGGMVLEQKGGTTIFIPYRRIIFILFI